MKNKETLEEALNNYITDKHSQEECIGFIDGYELAQKRSYSEEEVLDILDHHTSYLETFIYQYIDRQDIEVNEEWFKQFKKK